ncbi:MAG TPA: CYTH domain-containing protein [Desulfomonilaceae bacterium]|nr:CYTH domain-containing protein [Desulfomonilaceae bacterium]
MRFIERYELVPKPDRLIHDIYFDTADGSLGKKRWALRLRVVGGRLWVALKGPGEPVQSAGIRRPEVELPWSQTAVDNILERLSKLVTDFSVHTIPVGLSGQDAFIAMGFQIIQDRHTNRRIRDVCSTCGELLAEMALDAVTYHLRDQDLFHDEIEIEAKSPADPAVLKTVVSYLLQRFGPRLRRWNHGKLATGKTLEELIGRYPAAPLLTATGHATPALYDKLEECMK